MSFSRFNTLLPFLAATFLRHLLTQIAGQLEARERLLSEMELKARERVEAAEIESYRLKGHLVCVSHLSLPPTL